MDVLTADTTQALRWEPITIQDLTAFFVAGKELIEAGIPPDTVNTILVFFSTPIAVINEDNGKERIIHT